MQSLSVDGFAVSKNPHVVRGNIVDDDELVVDDAALKLDVKELEAFFR